MSASCEAVPCEKVWVLHGYLGACVFTGKVNVDESNMKQVAGLMPSGCIVASCSVCVCFFCFFLRSSMPPPPKKFKGESNRGGTGSATPSPSTPSPAPGTPVDAEPPAKKRRNTRQAKEVLPTTPLTRGQDAQDKLMKFKSQCDTLALTLRSLPYTQHLVKDMETFAAEFELLGCRWLWFTLFSGTST